MGKAALFTGKSDAYLAGRQGYPEELFAHLRTLCPPMADTPVLDVGAGTGLFSRGLVQSGYRVCAVEPLAEMRQKFAHALPDVPVYATTAEHTALRAQSVAMITAASAFHWFDAAGFARECRRILRANGVVCLVYHARRVDELFVAQSALMRRCCPKFTSLNHGSEYTRAQAARFFAPGYGFLRLENDFVYDPQAFVQRSLSSSYVPQEAAAQCALTQALHTLVQPYVQQGQLRIANDTLLWWGSPQA